MHARLLPGANEERVGQEERIGEVVRVAWTMAHSPEDDDVQTYQLMEGMVPVGEAGELMEQPT